MFYLYLVLALTHWLDFNLAFDFIRMSDILIIFILFCFICQALHKGQIVKPNIFAILFFVSLLFSTLYGCIFLVRGYDQLIYIVVFLYKWIWVFMLYHILITMRLTTLDIQILLYALGFSCICVAVYVIYFIFNFHDFYDGWNYIRPDFPFRKRGGTTLGAYLVTVFGIVVVSYDISKNGYLRYFVFLPIAGLIFTLIMYTGSRTPVVAIAVGVLCLVFYHLFIVQDFSLFRKINAIIRKNMILFGILFLVIVFSYISGVGKTQINRVLLLKQGLAATTQNEKAIGNLKRYLHNSTILLGTGPSYVQKVWCDDSVTRFLSDTGMLGTLAFLLLISFIVSNLYKISDQAGAKHLFLYYVIPLAIFCTDNLSGEYFMVNRVGVPVIIYLALIHKKILIQRAL